jgi:2-phosphoglycerate kinase
VRLALQLKKTLVDSDRLEIGQEELEHTLFAIMHSNSYGPQFVSRYRLVTAFNSQRLPVIILIAGTPFSGKTSLATLLSERLNAPSLIQSLLVYEVVRSLGSSHPDFCLQHDLPSWLRPHSSYDSFLQEFKREGSMVRQGLEGDLCKCLDEVPPPAPRTTIHARDALQQGKVIIVEGTHVDPSQFLSFSKLRCVFVPVLVLPARAGAAPRSIVQRSHISQLFCDHKSSDAEKLEVYEGNVQWLHAYLSSFSSDM